MSRLEEVFSILILELVHRRQFFLSRGLQRRSSLVVTTKIPRLSTGTTRKFKRRRSRSTISSVSDVFADEATTRDQAGLSVSGMKLRSEKNLNGDKGAKCWGRIGERDINGSLRGGGANADPTGLPPSCGPGRARRGLRTGGRPRSVPRSNREKNYFSKERPNRRLRVTILSS